MKMLTYFNAKEKAEQRIDVLENSLGDLGNRRIWNKLMRVLRQKNKFTDRLITLMRKADEADNFHISERAMFIRDRNEQIVKHTTSAE